MFEPHQVKHIRRVFLLDKELHGGRRLIGRQSGHAEELHEERDHSVEARVYRGESVPLRPRMLLIRADSVTVKERDNQAALDLRASPRQLGRASACARAVLV